MIVTCKKEIPARWIVFTILPWASFSFNYGVVSAAFVFSLKKFVENPAGVTFVLSLPGFIAIIAAPVAGFLSDRIWTRFGRRKPFVVGSSAGMIVALVLMPVMPNLWGLCAAYVLYHLADALSAPRDPLKQEIVPPHERGRATGAMTWCGNLATVIFYSVMLGRFDDVSYFAGFPLHGETVIYWSAALLLMVMLLLIALGIREVDQKSPLRGERLSLRNLVGGLLDRELWPVYLLVLSFGLVNFYSFGPFLSTLLYTDQWGYTKQEMGANVAIGGIVNVFIIGLLTFFADRLPRMRAYQILIYLSLAWNTFYYCYVEFILPDHRPSLVEIIVFGEVLSILGILLSLIYMPLIYDYVQRNKMGTFAAGNQIVTRGTQLLTLNGLGLFIWAWATFFQPPAGEMTRVALREPVIESELVSALRAATWTNPADDTPTSADSITAKAWQADGVSAKEARAWEIRLRDASSEQLATEKKNLEKERAPLLLRDKQSDLADASSPDATTGRKEQIRDLTQRAEAIDSRLVARSAKLREQVIVRLQDRLMIEGEQVRSAQLSPVLLLEIATNKRPDPKATERLVDDLRKKFPALIDLRPLKRTSGYGLALSAQLEPSSTESEQANQLHAALSRAAAKRDPDLLSSGLLLGVRRENALTFELQVVEQPVATYLSPITGAVNASLGLFDAAPSPTRRLAAIARNLRLVEETNHVRVTAGASPRIIAITTIFQPSATRAPSAQDVVGRRFAALLGASADADLLLRARSFHDRVEKAAATQLLTVVHPVLATGYMPLRYDYMSGYLWVFAIGLLGVGITVIFGRMESRGMVRKRGVEEAKAS